MTIDSLLSSDALTALDEALTSPWALIVYVIGGTLLAAAVILCGLVLAYDAWHAGRHIGRHRPPHGRKAVAR